MKMRKFLSAGLILAVAATPTAVSAQSVSPDDLKDKQKKIEKKIKKEEKAIKVLKNRVGKLEGDIAAVSQKLVSTEEEIKIITEEIDRRKRVIADYEKRLALRRELLADLLRDLRRMRSEETSSAAIALGEESPALGIYLDQFTTLRRRAMEEIRAISAAKEKLSAEKEKLGRSEEEKRRLLNLHRAQKQELVGRKTQVVREVKKKEYTVAQLRNELKKVAAALSRLTAKSYSTNDLREAIAFASRKTGVRKGFLFGMIRMESGGNTRAGRCTYKNAGMSKNRKQHFREIVKNLNKAGKKYDYKKMPLSCASKNYPGSGGAMGVAQFMPDTWAGYSARISAATGNYPADPWSLTDGVMAMALKLKNDGATRKGKVRVKNPCNGKRVKVTWEEYASMRYLGWSCWGYTNYRPGIQNLAKNYSKL